MAKRKTHLGGPTLKERKKSGTQAQRRRAAFAATRETSGPRKGLVKAIGAHGGSPKPEKAPSRLSQVANTIATPRRKVAAKKKKPVQRATKAQVNAEAKRIAKQAKYAKATSSTLKKIQQSRKKKR